MTEIQKELLKLILEVDTICKKYEIEYYLEGGSALGAIRHGGFLPWDDDADLAMTRANWEKFKLAIKAENPSDRVLESSELNELYPTMSNRYIDTSTTNLWRSLMLDICACGVGIDIFVLEAAPDDDSQLEQMKCDLIDYSEYINRFYRISSLGDSKRYKALRKLEKTVARHDIANALNQKLQQYNETSCTRYLMRWAYRFQVYDKEVFGKPRYVPFEGNHLLPVPEKVYDYLDYQFGPDWYMIPSPEMIDTHDTVLDLSVSYRKYTEQYMSIIDRDEALATNQAFKDLEMEALEYNKKYHHFLYSTTAYAEGIITAKACEALGEAVWVAFDEISDKTEALFQSLFGNYLTKQLNQWYLFYHVFVPLDDRYLYVILSYLFRSGRIRKGEKLFSIRIEQEMPLSVELQDLYNDLLANKRILARFWEDLEEDELCVCKTLFPAPRAVRLCRNILHCEKETLTSFCEIVEREMATFPKEDMFKLCNLLLQLRIQGGPFCREGLIKLRSETDNGMIRMWIDSHAALFD